MKARLPRRHGLLAAILPLALPFGVLLAAAGRVAAEGEELPSPAVLIVPGLIVIALVLLNGLFVAAEFAIIGVRATQMEQLSRRGNATARQVLAVLRSPAAQDRYIATAQLGITIASLILGMYGEPAIGHFIEPYLARLLGRSPEETLVHTLGYVVVLSLLTYLHVVVGEMVPKSLALIEPGRMALLITPAMSLAQTIFAAPVRVANLIGNLLLRALRIPPAGGHARLYSADELDMVVAESARGGMLDKDAARLVHHIFDFSQRRVDAVMVPRHNVAAIAHDMPLPELLAFVSESRFSRFPVYEGSLDRILGVLHVKDLVRQQLTMRGAFDIRLLLRPTLFVSEHARIESVLALLKNQRMHLAVVADEFGGTAGIVTLEDLLEEIVGEVHDEFDVESEPLVEIAPGVLEVSGRYSLDELHYHVDLGREEYWPDVETVGGLMMSVLGRIPKAGDGAVFNGLRFTVLAMDGFAVKRVRVEA